MSTPYSKLNEAHKLQIRALIRELLIEERAEKNPIEAEKMRLRDRIRALDKAASSLPVPKVINDLVDPALKEGKTVAEVLPFSEAPMIERLVMTSKLVPR